MEEQIFEARMRLLMKQWPTIWGGNLAVQTLTAIILWPYFSHLAIIMWCISNYVLFIIRLCMRQHFEACIRAGHDALRRWSNQYVLSAIVGGLIWGSASWLFFDSSDSETTLLLLLVLIGLSVGALPALSSYSPAFIAFVCAVLLPTTLRLATLDGLFAYWIALFTMIFLVISIFYSRQLDRTISKSITADLHNRALLEEVSEARNMAEEANRSKSTFLAAVSHDLRQPLHAMGLFMDALSEQLKETKQQATFANIHTAHDSLIKMFDALLEMTRLDSGSVKPVLTHFLLQPLFDELNNNFSAQEKQKKLHLEVSCSDSIVVYSDNVLLFAILSNLLSNAFKYTEKGSVRLNCEEQGEHIIIHVTDTGCGIPKEAYEKIFLEYQQLENPERDASLGLGLGLAMVKRTCQLLNHSLHLDSSPGEGSTFSVTLPYGQADQIINRQLDPLQQRLNGWHILVIDDNAAIRTGTEDLLTRWGCIVTTSDSDEQALIDVSDKERPVDLLICDYRLRGEKTGVEAIATMREKIDTELPALLITGDTDPALHNQLKQNGFYVLRKPIRPAQLKNAIASLVN